MLNALNQDKVCFIIFKSRELAMAIESTEGDSSNATDDGFESALTTANDKPTRAELRAFIEALDKDEATELVALCWLGRDDFSKEEWKSALAAAADRDGPSTAAYLLDIDLLPDYLSDGLAAFDLNCDDFSNREFLT